MSELRVSEIRATYADAAARSIFIEEGQPVRDTRALLVDASRSEEDLSPSERYQRILDARQERLKQQAKDAQLDLDADWG